MVVRGDDVVCLSDDDGLNHINTLLWIRRFGREKSVVEPCVWSLGRSNWALLGH